MALVSTLAEGGLTTSFLNAVGLLATGSDEADRLGQQHTEAHRAMEPSNRAARDLLAIEVTGRCTFGAIFDWKCWCPRVDLLSTRRIARCCFLH